jgi:iron(III) transport system substrate-binding protein
VWPAPDRSQGHVAQGHVAQGGDLPVPHNFAIGCHHHGHARGIVIAALCLILLAVAIWLWLRPSRDALVVYCAHDLAFSEPILRWFEQRTGIPVVIVPDTEASKSLGLTQRILAEKDRPRCDVFWNNEPLGTMDLADAGVLEAYQGDGWRRMPAAYKEADGLWTGFAARMRVWIVNTARMPATIEAVGRAQDGDLSRIAVAKPLFGTTRTHYTVLWHFWGGPTLTQWHRDWRKAGVIELAGNGPVKNQVAAGKCDLGLTDTDDFFVALDDGKPVDMVPYTLHDGRAMVIPNTVAIIKGTRKQAQARQLVEFLLSQEVELLLAASPSRQIPLGPVEEAKLPPQVRPLRKWIDRAYPLNELGDARAACLQWLRKEYVP